MHRPPSAARLPVVELGDAGELLVKRPGNVVLRDAALLVNGDRNGARQAALPEALPAVGGRQPLPAGRQICMRGMRSVRLWWHPV